jgi:hypothetical protein
LLHVAEAAQRGRSPVGNRKLALIQWLREKHSPVSKI